MITQRKEVHINKLYFFRILIEKKNKCYRSKYKTKTYRKFDYFFYTYNMHYSTFL